MALLLGALALGVLLPAADLQAACNIIPGTARSFAGSLGVVDRPFAKPGDLVEIRLSPTCHGASPGFGLTPADHVVAVVFTPPGAAPTAVALATSCAAVEPQLQACGLPAGRCLTVNGVGEPTGIQLFSRDADRRLRFRFPDTDALLDGAADDRTLSGPARVAVLDTATPFPCALLNSPCTAVPDLRACVDRLFEVDGTCGATPGVTFAHFTALPPPNDYQRLCYDPVPPCNPVAPEIRFTTDTEGNVLVPMDWRGILVGEGVPIARLLQARSSLEASLGGGAPIVIPGNAFLKAFSPEGGLLPPVFDPQADPSAVFEATLFGTADAPQSVLRVSRRSPVFQECSGGAHDGLPCIEAGDCPAGSCDPTSCVGGGNAGNACAGDGDCPGGECGPSLFEFRDRYRSVNGPVVVERFGAGVCQTGGTPCTTDGDCGSGPCVAFRLQANDPVPLEALNQTADLFAFVVPEAIEGVDLNADGDETDDVVVLRDRRSGTLTAVGNGGSAGRAVTRLRQSPFTFPIVAVENDVIAFLEPEPLEGDCSTPANCDRNGDGDVFDTILRAFRLDGSELTTSLELVADAAPRIDGRSLAASGGRIFFRSAEWADTPHVTTRVDVAPNGAVGNGVPGSSRLSPNGRYVNFSSGSSNISVGDVNSAGDVFVHDRDSDGNGIFDEPGGIDTVLVSVDSSGQQAFGGGGSGAMSADTRHVAFMSVGGLLEDDADGVSDIFVRDRDTDGNGIFDEPGGVLTRMVSVKSNGAPLPTDPNRAAEEPTISADGRRVSFSNAAPGEPHRVFVHDRDADGNGTFDEPGGFATFEASVNNQGVGARGPQAVEPQISGDGGTVVFASGATNLLPGHVTGGHHVYARDLVAGTTNVLSVPPGDDSIEGGGFRPAVSADGRFVSFESLSPLLSAGDTNDATDAFVVDRDADGNGVFDEVGRTALTRVSLASDGSQPATVAAQTSLSADGRFVSFAAIRPVPFSSEAVVHDRLTGLSTTVAAVAGEPRLSGDGRSLVYVADGIFVHGPDTSQVAADLTGDGDLEDTVLRVFDSATSSVANLCPAGDVAVEGGAALFLRPEAAGAAPGCPAGSSLNGDVDTGDQVVHFWTSGSGVENLGCAATAIGLSGSWIAALVSETEQGNAPLNGDGDQADDVVHVYPRGGPMPASCGGWTNVGRAGEALAVRDDVVAFLTAEAAQGAVLNSDGDQADRVLQVYRPALPALTNVGRAAEDFVLGATLVALRVRETAQGADLNGDGDLADDVLQVHDLATGGLINSGQAVIPCRLEACDPRLPYRVLSDTVKFLTREQDQGEDLNGDGDEIDLLLQTFNVRLAQESGAGAGVGFAAGGSARHSRTRRDGPVLMAGALTAVGSVSLGICTDTAESCTENADCPAGTCFVPPGGCIQDLGTPCTLDLEETGCGASEFCRPLPGQPGLGTCFAALGESCRDDSDCSAPAFCNDDAADIQRLAAPLSDENASGEVFVGAGRCVEDLGTACTTAADCAAGELCPAGGGNCRREHGPCTDDADCVEGSACRRSLLLATARDSDGDELSDPFDNCPLAANILQEDADLDGIGDACDAATCGDSSIVADETCDDGDLDDGDGCDSNCTVTACGNGVVSPPGSPAAEDCDDGNRVDGDGCDADCRPTAAAVTGAKLLVADDQSDASRRRVLFLSLDGSAIGSPVAGAASDPTVAGARLVVANPTTSETASFPLPAANWKGLGNPSGARGYRYSDPASASGPCKRVLLKPGRLLKATCLGSLIPFTLDEPTQGGLAVGLITGHGNGALRYCARFGGEILTDRPASGAANGLFRGKDAPRPTECPLP